MKVNTFIVGAPKAGTTSLHHYLNQHTQVSMSSIKEPDFFSCREVSSLFYNSKSIQNSKDYEKLFDETKPILGEASVSYLFYQDVPKRIKDYNKDAKIIIMLRQPIERAFSHYLMDSRLGYCHLEFDHIFKCQEKYPQFFQQYFELGLYHDQVKRYITAFGKENVKILFYDDFKKDTSLVMKEVFDFLNVDNLSLNYSIQNPFVLPSNTLVAFLYKFDWLRKSFNIIFTKQNIKRIKKLVFSKKEKPKVSEHMSTVLKDYYLEDIGKLESLLKTDLSHWK
ncbi:MAG: sulfotransferase domain-containing protein [Flavobacteriales bacterium]